MDRQAFKQRMKQLKQYREQNPGKTYLDFMEQLAEYKSKEWNADPDLVLTEMLNDNTYNYNQMYKDNPNMSPSEGHFTDTYKTVYHPTFSEESMYSGSKSQYNPDGIVGGSWDYDNKVFKAGKQQNIKYAQEYLNRADPGWKASYADGGQTGDPDEYITQQIQQKRKQALLKSQQRDKGVLPVVGGRPNPISREQFMQTREQDIQKASRDVEDFKRLAEIQPFLYQQKLDVANKKLQALQATTYQPTIGGEIGPGCIYTATDNYGPMYQRASNVEFESLPASKSGFTKVPLNKVQAGDIVIRHGDNGSRHAMIFDSYGPDSTMLYNHSNGGGETTDYRHKGRYPSKKEQLNAYTFTGTHNDSVNWKKQAGFADGGEIGNDDDKDPSVLDKVKGWAKDLYLAHKYKSSAAAMEIAYNFQNRIPSVNSVFRNLKKYFNTDMPNGVREDFDVQDAFLLDEEDQRKIMQKAGFQVIDIDKEDNPYGLVNKAVKRHKKRVPVYQDNSKSDTTIVRDDVQPIANAYEYSGTYGVGLMHANSYPKTMYVHKKTGKLYVRGWDLNDYGVDPNGSGISKSYNKLSRFGANMLDKVGTPFVQRSGFVPFDEKARYDQLDDKTKQAIKTARHRVKFDSFYADGGEVPPSGTDHPVRKPDIFQPIERIVDGRKWGELTVKEQFKNRKGYYNGRPAEPGLEIVSPEFELMTGLRGALFNKYSATIPIRKGSHYRVVGKEAVEDAKQSGIIRQKNTLTEAGKRVQDKIDRGERLSLRDRLEVGSRSGGVPYFSKEGVYMPPTTDKAVIVGREATTPFRRIGPKGKINQYELTDPIHPKNSSTPFVNGEFNAAPAENFTYWDHNFLGWKENKFADGGEIPPTNKPTIPEKPEPYKGKLIKDRYGKKYTETQVDDYYSNSTDEIDRFTGKPLVRGLKPALDIEDAANVTPVGDAMAAYDAYSSARQGDWVGAGLSTLAVLPFVPMKLKDYRRKYKGITPKVKTKGKLNSTAKETKPFNTTVNKDRTQQLIDQVTNKQTANNSIQAKVSNQGYKIAERLMDDPEYLDRALEVKKKFGDDYTQVYADIIDAYNNDPNSYLPVVDVYNNSASAVNGSMRNMGHGNYNYTVNADMADLSANLTEHEWSHYADFKRNLDRPDAHGDSNMFYQMSKDLDNKKIDSRDSYYQMPTEQKAHMNQLREYMFQNGYISKRGETIESKMMKNVLDGIKDIPSMKGVFRASQQFKNINKYTKWFNSIPLLGVGAAAMYNENKNKSNQKK